MDNQSDTAWNTLTNNNYTGLQVTVSSSFATSGAKTFTFGPVGPIGDPITLIPNALASAGGVLEAAQVATVSTAGGYGTKNYYMMLPNPFDKEGLYLGAIGKGDKITCRIKTQDLRYTQAASGTLAVATTPGINLVMWVDHVPQDQAADHLGYWMNRAWRSTEYILEQPSQSVQLTTTGMS